MAASRDSLTIESYSEKALVVRGETKPFSKELSALGGKWNDKLRDGPGWIFPKTKKADILEWQESGKVTQTQSQSQYSNSSTDNKVLMAKLNRIESLLLTVLSKLEKEEEEDDDEDEVPMKSFLCRR